MSEGDDIDVALAMLPTAEVTTSRPLLLESAAIASGVLALVLWLDAPAFVWFVVLALAALRPWLRECGVDVMLAAPRKERASRRQQRKVVARQYPRRRIKAHRCIGSMT